VVQRRAQRGENCSTAIRHPHRGDPLSVDKRLFGEPWRFSETPAHIGVAPQLGARQRRRARLYPAQIEDFRERKII
jgi:hypothetical protein